MGVKVWLHLFLPDHHIQLSGQLHALVIHLRRKSSRYCVRKTQMGPTANLKGKRRRISRPYRESEVVLSVTHRSNSILTVT